MGWATGSPFQLEMGFANLLVGVLGLMAVGRRDGFRSAAILATTIIGFGATAVHLPDIVATGNLAPGNTIQNLGNLLDPLLLIGLTWLAARIAIPTLRAPLFCAGSCGSSPSPAWPPPASAPALASDSLPLPRCSGRWPALWWGLVWVLSLVSAWFKGKTIWPWNGDRSSMA